MAGPVRYETEGAIATLTLDRPEALNAYTPEMGDALVRGFGRARDDATVRAIILTGAGRGFCAGVDLEVMKRHQADEGDGGPRLGEEAFVRSFPLELARFPGGGLGRTAGVYAQDR